MQDSDNINTGQQENLLIEQAKNGDADAFGELYLLNMDAIYRYVYFRTSNTYDAEDLTEQVFLKAWQALPGYKQQGHPFTSWLYRIAHNVVVDFHRSQRNKTEMSTQDNLHWGTEQSSSLERLIQAEETAALAAAVSELPETQQQVIILRFIEGLDHSVIARILNKSNGACRTIQYRALSALNRILSGVRVGNYE